MHVQNLVHRDLKLLNIFMCDSSEMPRVKVGDLGLAVCLKPGESIIKRAGTVAFMAPEVLAEQPTDFKSDIWSLGCLLYEMAALQSPFYGQWQIKKGQDSNLLILMYNMTIYYIPPGDKMNLYSLCKKIEQCDYPPLPSDQYSDDLRQQRMIATF